MKENINSIVKRIAVKINATLASPALIGSGESENTDNDILLNHSDTPYLPGTSLAGILRSKLTNTLEADKMFGDDVGGRNRMSALWVMDANFEKKIIELDGVALDYDNKVATGEMKYDFEAVERNTEFTMRLMLIIREEDVRDNKVCLENILSNLLAEFCHGNISVGAKTNRGFGKILCEEKNITSQVFDFKNDKSSALDAWEKFSWEDSTAWKPAKIGNHFTDNIVITRKLRLKGSIMIRDTGNLDDRDVDVDYKHISSNNIPVIYGTSWAGAFKGGLYKLLKPKYGDKTEKYLNKYFGSAKKDDTESVPSVIKFDMSELRCENKKYDGYRSITRIKIDRFTGGAANGALFTECPWIGGTTELTVRYHKDCPEARKLIHLAFDAMNKGLLTVGGETSVGRGIFEIVERENTQ